jgi:toxin ParE1/3/4
VIDSLTERIYFLSLNPRIGRPRDYDLRQGIRSFAVGHYIIFYRLEEEDVRVLHVLRGGRSVDTLFHE